MSRKALLSSDIHIFDYAQHRLFGDPKFRINQFELLADRYIDIAKKAGARDFIIAGDIIHHAILGPRVSHVTRNVFRKLSEYFDNIYFILGQHDMDSRNQEFEYEDSVVGLLADFPNVYYMNRKILTIAGVRVGFANWQPVQDWSFIEDKVDMMVGHVTISSMFGQEYDTSKYDIGFFGDIHAHGMVGNSVKIGVPIQHSLGDAPDVAVIVLDLDGSREEKVKWERVPTINEEFKFLRILHGNPEPGDDEYTVRIQRNLVAEKVREAVASSIDVDAVIDKVVNDFNLSEVHKWVLNNTSVPADETIDFGFKLLGIKIENFRSIDYFEHKFDGGTTYIYGHNGSGKSSFLGALDYALRDYARPKTFLRRGAKRMSVTLDISYHGVVSTIVRGYEGSAFCEFHQNGTPVPADNLAGRNKKIAESLPFLKHLDMLIFRQGRSGFLSSYGYDARVDLISRMVGLGKVKYYLKTASQRLDGYASALKQTRTQIAAQEAILSGITDIDESLVNEDFSARLESLKTTESNLCKLIDTMNAFSTTNTRIADIKKVIEQNLSITRASIPDDVEAKMAETNRKISDMRIVLQEHADLKARHESTVNKGDLLIEQKKRELAAEEAKLAGMTTSSCYVCGSHLDVEKTEQLRHDVRTVIETIQADIRKIENIRSTLVPPDEEVAKNATLTIESLSVELASLRALESQVKLNKQLDEQLSAAQSNLENLTSTSTREADAIRSTMSLLEITNLSMELATGNLASVREEITQVRNNIAKRDMAVSLIAKRDAAMAELATLRDTEVVQDAEHIAYDKYTEMLGNKGAVISTVLATLAESLSSDTLRVRTSKTLANNETRPDLTVDLLVKKEYIEYDMLSGGQKTYADLYILRELLKVKGNVGMALFDESLKELDADNVEAVSEMLAEYPCEDMFICTHVLNFPNFDQSLQFKLNEEGVSVIRSSSEG